MKFLKQLFTWWNSQTVGTMIFTWWKGNLVGSDDRGNMFYETRESDRRWVIFKKSVEASSVSADWHGWLHHTIAIPPSSEKKFKNAWEKPHRENTTGSEFAYHPLGIKRTKMVNYSDYEAWSPEND
ncbi:MAG: NADH:ubiquinone oxidoreductase subunit NDUFA12 [Paracoccaceae bacterium]|nr:NADH:ubiquinone oxidoreductase subunit NDUFA12 [Paracoccaceae bacterium]